MKMVRYYTFYQALSSIHPMNNVFPLYSPRGGFALPNACSGQRTTPFMALPRSRRAMPEKTRLTT